MTDGGRRHPADGPPATRADILASRQVWAPKVLGTPDHGAHRLHVVGRKRVRVHPGAPEDVAARWPASTDVWCWHCCHPFDTAPLPMPTGYDDRRDVFHVMGTFCSWGCVKAFNRGDSRTHIQSVNSNLITLFHMKTVGKLAGIRSAPPRLALKAFGGHMDIEEFRAASDRPAAFTILPARLVVHHHTVHEEDLTKTARPKRATDLKEVVNFKDVSVKNETLRLKRPKPLQNNKNMIEKTMGIAAFRPG